MAWPGVAVSSARRNLGLQFLEDLAHDWASTLRMEWGHYDQWVPNKSATTMAYLTRATFLSITLSRRLYCLRCLSFVSFVGSADPNRYQCGRAWSEMMAGAADPYRQRRAGYDWSTYPELLQHAGVSGRSIRTAAWT